jgi:hypothetical protein
VPTPCSERICSQAPVPSGSASSSHPTGSYDGQPEVVVEKVRIAYLKGDGKVVHVAPDGLKLAPGFIVFVKDSRGHTYLCNATSDAAV